jgi:hypothetical protein
VGHIRKCFSGCERSPTIPRISRRDPEWQPAYNECIGRCTRSGGEFEPVKLNPMGMSCARQLEFERAGYHPGEIRQMIGAYDPLCNDQWQYVRFGGKRKPRVTRARKLQSLRSAIKGIARVPARGVVKRR